MGGGLAVGCPGHLTGHAVNADLQHGSNKAGGEVILVLGGDARILEGSCDGKYGIVAVGCELVGGLAVVGGLVSGNELLYVFIGSIRGKGGEKHYALGICLVGDLADKSVKTVASEGDHAVERLGLGSLSEDLGSVCGVDGQEDELSSGFLDGGYLSREVGVGGVGVGLNGEDLDTVLCALGFEGVIMSLSVVFYAVVEDRDLCGKFEVLDVLCRSGAL